MWAFRPTMICACVLAMAVAGCRVSILDPVLGEWHETSSLRVSAFDKDGTSGTSMHLDLDEVLEDKSAGEECQPFDDVDFWLSIQEMSQDRVAVTVRVKDEPAQKFEMSLGERREFRPSDPDKRIAISYSTIGYSR